MGSATAKPAKKLVEFLKEQQEPFILEVYLLERGYSTRRSPNGESTKCSERWATSFVLNKKKENLFPFSKVLTALHKKLSFHNQNCIVFRDSDTDSINEHVDVSVPHVATTLETDRFSFSTATSSTVYNSCSDIDEDGISMSPHRDKPLFSSDTCQASRVNDIGDLHSQEANDNEKHHQRCLEVSVTHKTLNKDVSGMGHGISNCCVLVPEKITEDSLLSAALWSSLIRSAKREGGSKELRELLGPGPNPNVCHVLKSKTLLCKAKQLLFDCVREITMNVSRKDDRGQEQGYRQFREPEELGKLIWERTKWSEQGGKNETNLTYLLTLDYLDSMDEWSELKPQVRHICVEIAGAILERVTGEIVSDMIGNLPPTLL
ncbi:uncharacterized protein LOC113866255 [Abrus precatorius]|uniref:Uncharacterized protein LOC113866255 n=1 Tax=Abrus precatorius TaxID=3816 RepID=A0A8B8LKZ6_ABRPR|nr:uncharacterized protein LOC113866255 [Abrus precatorius]